MSFPKISKDLVVVCAVLCTVLIAGRTKRIYSHNAVDYYHFWLVGQAIRTMDVRDIYSPGDRKRVGQEFVDRAEGASKPQKAAARRREMPEPTATPLLYAVFDLISTGDYDRDYRHFAVVSLVVYFLGIYGLWRAAGLRPEYATVPTLLSAAFWPLWLDMKYGNVTQIQIFLVAAFFVALRGSYVSGGTARFIAGLILSFAFFFKPNVIYPAAAILIMAFVSRQIGVLKAYAIAFVTMGLVAWFVPYWLFGSACTWTSWFHFSPDMMLTQHFIKDSFPSVVFGSEDTRLHRTLAISALCGLAAILLRGRKDIQRTFLLLDRDRVWTLECLSFGLGFGIFLLTDPFIHGQYLSLVIPMAAIVVGGDDLSSRHRTERLISVAGLFFIAMNPKMRWHMLYGPGLQWLNYAGVCALTFSAVLSLIKTLGRSEPFPQGARPASQLSSEKA